MQNRDLTKNTVDFANKDVETTAMGFGRVLTQHVRDITNLEGRCQPHGQFLVVVQQKFTKRSFLRICPSQL